MLGRKGEGGCVVWQKGEQRGRRTRLDSAADSQHLSCQAFHHSVQLENEEKTQVRISQRNPDAFHENKQGHCPLALVSVSLLRCECVYVSVSGSLGACVCFLCDYFCLLAVGLEFGLNFCLCVQV